MALIALFELGNGGQKNVGSFEIAEHAEIKEIAGVACRLDRRVFFRSQPVEDDDSATPRHPDLMAIGLGLVSADMNDCVGEALEQSFDGEIDAASGRTFIIVQAAAVRRIETR